MAKPNRSLDELLAQTLPPAKPPVIDPAPIVEAAPELVVEPTPELVVEPTPEPAITIVDYAPVSTAGVVLSDDPVIPEGFFPPKTVEAEVTPEVPSEVTAEPEAPELPAHVLAEQAAGRAVLERHK